MAVLNFFGWVVPKSADFSHPKTNQTPMMGQAHLYLLSTIEIGPNRAQPNPYSAQPGPTVCNFDRF